MWTGTLPRIFTQKPSCRAARMFLLPLWLEGILRAIWFHFQINAVILFTASLASPPSGGFHYSATITACLGIYCPLRPDPLPLSALWQQHDFYHYYYWTVALLPFCNWTHWCEPLPLQYQWLSWFSPVLALETISSPSGLNNPRCSVLWLPNSPTP